MKRVPDGYAKKSSDCGDTIELFLEVDNGLIRSVNYEVCGCQFTLACARAVVELARGQAVNEIRTRTTAVKIDEVLGGLPATNKHCADLASAAMSEAVTEAAIASREPWRKLYRKQ